MEKRIITTDVTEEDFSLEGNLRPQTLDDYIGQEKTKSTLKVYIEAAKQRHDALDHVLFYGPPGLGKTTLAGIIANEMGVNIKITSGPAIEKPGEMAAILNNLQENDILFVDEIHRLNRQVEEVLYPAMEDYAIDIMIGKGASARSIRLDLPKFTLVGATTRAGMLTAPLRDRFGVIHHLELYTEEELTKLKQEFLEKKSIKNSSDDEDANDNFEMLEKGFEYQLTNSTNYIALDKEQNLVKNKIVLKMDLLNEQILSKISNRLLIKTIGNAFSSLELIHYKDIKQDEIIELPKEIIDVLALLQQMPANLEYLDEIKNIIISKIPTLKLINNFTYKDFNLEDRELSIENLYKITGGRISYGDAIDLYKNAFYLSKSKKRTYNSVKILNKLLKNNHKYKNTLNYM